MRNKGPDQPAGCSQVQARPACTKCGNEAHLNKNACPATGRRCLKCGHLNHFARMCKDKQANLVGLEQEPNAHSVSQEEESFEEVYLYQLKGGKSQNPSVALNINGIPSSLHLDTQADVTVVTEKHYGKLKAKCILQLTTVAIRS